jgi:hypothetical protein
MNSGFAKRIWNIANHAKPYIGLCLLAVIILWVLKEGYPIEKMSFTLISSTLLAAMASSFANAMIISEISKVYGGAMNYKSSLHITALGTFANAAGGIPIGTALKFILLHKRGKLSVAQTTTGFVVFTISISLALLLYVTVLIHWLDIHDTYRSIAALVLIVSMAILATAVACLKYFPRIHRHLSPFLKYQVAFRILIISIIVTLGFILSFWVVTYQLFPQMTFVQTAFSVSLGSLVSQMAFLQSVGGIQELSIGIATSLTGAEVIHGVMLGLTIRLAALASSGLIVASFTLHSGKNAAQRA